MARVPMITRTVNTTEATVLCVNIVEGEPFNKTVTVSGVYDDDKKLMKEVSKLIDNDTEKAVHIVKVETKETLYGMTVAQFIANAEILPPRTATETETETE